MRDGSSPFAMTSNVSGEQVGRPFGSRLLGLNLHLISLLRTASPAAWFDTRGLFRGENASTAADPGARRSVPEDLVDDEGHADGRDETEGGESSHLPRSGQQPKQQDCRDRSSPPEAATDP